MKEWLMRKGEELQLLESLLGLQVILFFPGTGSTGAAGAIAPFALIKVMTLFYLCIFLP